jgi:hypothetical protein
MLRDLAPAEGGPSVELIEEPTAEQAAAFYAAARENGFAFALDAKAARAGRRRRSSPAHELLAAGCGIEAAEKKTRSSVGVCAEPATALRLPLTPELRALLEDASVPKRVHDWKLALHVLGGLGVELARRGRRHHAALLRAQSHARHADAGRCGRAPWAACALSLPRALRPFTRWFPVLARRG